MTDLKYEFIRNGPNYSALWDSQHQQPAHLPLQSSYSFYHLNVAALTNYTLR